MLDTALNALMLALAVRLGGSRIRPGRILPGALAGAAAAAWARTLALERTRTIWLWLPTAMLMMQIAAGRQAMRTLVRNALLLFCAAGLLGGMVLSLWGATGSLASAYVLGCAAAIATGVCAVRSRRAALDVQKIRMICVYQGKSASFDAMVDSGNTLRDYLTHLPVIVVAEARAREALGLKNVPLRPIFAQTAGGSIRMDVLRPQEIWIEQNGRRCAAQALVALSAKLSVDTPALVPASLLAGQALQHTDGISNRGG